jgi:3-methyladenine DNA glycosylase AlkD
MLGQYKKAQPVDKEAIYRFYLDNIKSINNWNLVDASCRDIIGAHLLERDKSLLLSLAQSSDLWERRIAIVSTWAFIRKGQFAWTLKIAKILLNDNHDLIHKAVGWMLREVGGRDEAVLREFLNKHAAKMPRTMLRYAIEKFPESDRKHYLKFP